MGKERWTYDLQALEVGVDVAGAGESTVRSTPRAWIRGAIGDIGGDITVAEVPDTDSIAGPLSSVDAAAVAVEPCAEGLVRGRLDAAARVGVLARGLHETIAGFERAGEAGVIDAAAVAGVEGHVVLGLVIDTFDDIDFAVVGPVRAYEPAEVDDVRIGDWA